MQQHLPSHEINACFEHIERELTLLLAAANGSGSNIVTRHLEQLIALTASPEAGRMQEHARSMASFLASLGPHAMSQDDRTQLTVLLGHMRRLIRPWDAQADTEVLLSQKPLLAQAPLPASAAGVRTVAFWLDSKSMTAMLNATLNSAGYRCIDLDSLDDLNHPDTGLPSVIVADFALLNACPDIAARLQTLRTQRCALVGLSSQQDFAAQLAAVRMGVARFLPKPLDPVRLKVVIDSLCQQQEGGALRALLIDDNRSATAVHAEVLRQSGVQVEICHFPHLAIDLIDAFKPDIIVCDIYMPGCNGLELAAVLQQEDRHAQTPFLFLSTENDINTQLDAMDLGADGFLTKPIKPDILCTIVKAKARRGRTLRRIERETCALCPDKKQAA